MDPLPIAWHQGDHLALIGQTKSGKSTVAAELLKRRHWLIVFRSKTDQARQAIEYPVEKLVRKTSDLDWIKFSRYELRPRYHEQRREFALALDKANREGGWCCYLDETYHIDEELKLRPLINEAMTQGSGKGVTMVCGIQRPVGTTRFVLSQSLHVISFGMEGRDVTELAHATSDTMADVVLGLERFAFAWYERATRAVWCGKLNLETLKLEGAFV